MRLFLPLVCLALFGGCLLQAATPESKALAKSINAAKPLSLDLCFAENDVPLPLKTDPKTGLSSTEITADFYAHSLRTVIAVADQDQGKVAFPEHVDASYQIVATEDGQHEVTVLLDFHLVGRQNLIQTLKIPLDQWTVHSVIPRKTSYGDTFYFYVVIKLSQAETKGKK